MLPRVSGGWSHMTGYTPVTTPHESAPESPTSPDPDAGSDAEPDVRHVVDVPAAEVISRAAVMLMSAAAEHLGLADSDPEAPAHRDLDQARTLITALAGLVSASAPDLGPHAAAFREGLAALQGAFRDYSIHPDAPGEGPGEWPGQGARKGPGQGARR